MSEKSKQGIGSHMGAGKLANIIQSRITNIVAGVPPSIDFGTIQVDMSLKTDLYPLTIPAEDYMICRSVGLGLQPFTITEADGEHGHGLSGNHGGHISGEGVHSHPNTEGSHVHAVKLPEKMQKFKPGDRVLVVWVNSDAVVIDIIFPATEVI